MLRRVIPSAIVALVTHTLRLAPEYATLVFVIVIFRDIFVGIQRASGLVATRILIGS